MKNKVVVTNLSSTKINTKKIEIYILNIFKVINLENIYLEVYILLPKEMRNLNQIFRNQNKESSVLSFEEPKIPHPYLKYKPLGEIYLSSAQKSNFSYLLIHGLLHLLGYKHGSRMEKEEKRIMEKIQNYIF